MILIRKLPLIFSLLFYFQSYAQLKPARIFSDHMVLQRGVEIPVWGKSKPKEKVTVIFDGMSYSTTSDDKGGTDFFLLRNTTAENTIKTCSFRVTKKVAEIWDPVTGKIIPLNGFKQNEGHTELVLAFEPEQSYFVVFSEAGSNALQSGDKQAVNHLSDGKLIANETGKSLIDLSDDWQVHFDENWGGPANASFPELISWTERDEEGIKYYSGIAFYEKAFNYSKDEAGNEHVFLELEEIEKIAKVWLNGNEVGTIWCKPYRLDISEFLTDGTNQLRIDVANVWSNRLTGDGITGENYTNTNMPGGPRANNMPWAKVPLVPSGLIGKVEIKPYKELN